MRTRKIRIKIILLNYNHFGLKFYDIQNILTCIIIPVLWVSRQTQKLVLFNCWYGYVAVLKDWNNSIYFSVTQLLIYLAIEYSHIYISFALTYVFLCVYELSRCTFAIQMFIFNYHYFIVISLEHLGPDKWKFLFN